MLCKAVYLFFICALFSRNVTLKSRLRKKLSIVYNFRDLKVALRSQLSIYVF